MARRKHHANGLRTGMRRARAASTSYATAITSRSRRVSCVIPPLGGACSTTTGRKLSGWVLPERAPRCQFPSCHLWYERGQPPSWCVTSSDNTTVPTGMAPNSSSVVMRLSMDGSGLAMLTGFTSWKLQGSPKPSMCALNLFTAPRSPNPSNFAPHWQVISACATLTPPSPCSSTHPPSRLGLFRYSILLGWISTRQ